MNYKRQENIKKNKKNIRLSLKLTNIIQQSDKSLKKVMHFNYIGCISKKKTY